MPQIFFNSTYIGGNKELQEALDAHEARSELIELLKTEPVSVAGVSQAPTILSWPPATGVTGVNGVNQLTPTFQSS